ncbi:MAG: tRNA pseudouridine(38-40) synthase TruA [Desulfosarcinaceae bacterium]
MDKNFKLTIEYDGSAYHGWQRQPADPSIQAAIEDALEKMTRQKIVLTGSGRTDAGVHARGQTANFKCGTRLDPEDFRQGLNSLLSDDIVILECKAVPPDFHARFDTKGKHYRYTIRNHALPAAIGRQYAWWIRRPLDINAMQQALPCLLGRHDFKAFEGAGSPRPHTIREVYRADLLSQPPRLLFDIEADGFLRFMVRNIVGTLVAVGMGRIPAERCRQILESGDRGQAGATAPPQGLCLMEVRY